MRISAWSSDVCSSDLPVERLLQCQQVLACQTVYPVPVVRDAARLADDLVEVGSEYERDCLAAFTKPAEKFVVGRLAAPEAEHTGFCRLHGQQRTEEGRGGKESVGRCRSRR